MKMNNEELNTALYQKMEREQDKYRKWLVQCPPEEILSHDVYGRIESAGRSGDGTAQTAWAARRRIQGFQQTGNRLHGNGARCDRVVCRAESGKGPELGGEVMPVVSKEEIANARKMDLLSYLRAYEPGELVRFSGETYCTRTHDSLKISNGKWYWFSQNIGGRSALDYLVKVKEMSFPEAVKMLNGQAVQPICYEKPPPAPRKLLLPLLDTNTSKTEAYLKSRGIHPQIIAYCIQHGLLFQSENANDVIFVGYDTKGTRRYAALRSMTTNYKGEATGSDKHFSFALVADDRPVREVHVFEAAIDAMSYLSLAGVFASKRANVVPVALEQFLKDHSQITKVVLHLDNDRVGRQAAESIMGGLDKKYTVLNRPPRAGKDVNDYLRMEIVNRNGKERER